MCYIEFATQSWFIIFNFLVFLHRVRLIIRNFCVFSGFKMKPNWILAEYGLPWTNRRKISLSRRRIMEKIAEIGAAKSSLCSLVSVLPSGKFQCELLVQIMWLMQTSSLVLYQITHFKGNLIHYWLKKIKYSFVYIIFPLFS